MDNVLSLQQFKAQKMDRMLDSVHTPQEQLDALDESMRRHPSSASKRAKLRMVRGDG